MVPEAQRPSLREVFVEPYRVIYHRDEDVLVNSSAWLEYFGDGPNAQLSAKAIEKTDELVVPSLTLFEVFKRTLQLTDETTALNAVAVMMQGGVVDLSASLAIESARLSYVYPMGQRRKRRDPPEGPADIRCMGERAAGGVGDRSAQMKTI
ncbi:MAG: hypothetical protein ACYC5Q_12210 [Thermoleophilia bacterium]